MESNCVPCQPTITEWCREDTYTERLEEILGLAVNLELTALALGEVQSGDLWDVLILALTLLFLELEGDTTDWSTLNTLHEMGGVTSDLLMVLD